MRDGVIYGDHESVPFSEIASVERRESSPGKTTLLVVVILGVVGALAAADSTQACIPTPAYDGAPSHGDALASWLASTRFHCQAIRVNTS